MKIGDRVWMLAVPYREAVYSEDGDWHSRPVALYESGTIADVSVDTVLVRLDLKGEFWYSTELLTNDPMVAVRHSLTR